MSVSVCECDVHVHQSNESGRGGRAQRMRERERAQLKFNPKLLHPFGVLATPEWVKGLSSTHPLSIRLMCRLRWKRVYIYKLFRVLAIVVPSRIYIYILYAYIQLQSPGVYVYILWGGARRVQTTTTTVTCLGIVLICRRLQPLLPASRP